MKDVETREEGSGRRPRGFRLTKKWQNPGISTESSLRPALKTCLQWGGRRILLLLSPSSRCCYARISARDYFILFAYGLSNDERMSWNTLLWNVTFLCVLSRIITAQHLGGNGSVAGVVQRSMRHQLITKPPNRKRCALAGSCVCG